MKQKFSQQQDRQNHNTVSDIYKQVESLQSKDSTMRWRLQYNQKYTPGLMNIGEQDTDRGSSMRQKLKLQPRQRASQKPSPNLRENLTFNITATHNNYSLTHRSSNQQTQPFENYFSPTSKQEQILSKNNFQNLNQKTRSIAILNRKKANKFILLKIIISKSDDLSPKELKKLSKNSELKDIKQINTPLLSEGIQSLRHRGQQYFNPQRTFSLVDLKMKQYLNSERGQQKVNKLLDDDWNQNQVLYTVQNELEQKQVEKYSHKSTSPNYIISNENEQRKTQFSFAMTTSQKQKIQMRSDRIKAALKLVKNKILQKEIEEKQKRTPSPSIANTYHIIQSPILHHPPHKEYGEFFPNKLLQNNKRRTSPSLNDIELHKIQDKFDNGKRKVPILQLPVCKKEPSLERQTKSILLSPRTTFQKSPIFKLEMNKSDAKQLGLPSPPNLNTKKMWTEGNLPLSRQSSSKDMSVKKPDTEHCEMEMFEDEDWEIPQFHSIANTISKYYSKKGKSVKQAQILKQQEQMLQNIKKSHSILRISSNQLSNNELINQSSSQNSLVPYSEKEIKISSNRQTLLNTNNPSTHEKLLADKTQTTLQLQCKTDRISVIDCQPQIQTNPSINNGIQSERDHSPLSPQLRWVSTQLPFQNTSYELFSQAKKSPSLNSQQYIPSLLKEIQLNSTSNHHQQHQSQYAVNSNQQQHQSQYALNSNQQHQSHYSPQANQHQNTNTPTIKKPSSKTNIKLQTSDAGQNLTEEANSTLNNTNSKSQMLLMTGQLFGNSPSHSEGSPLQKHSEDFSDEVIGDFKLATAASADSPLNTNKFKIVIPQKQTLAQQLFKSKGIYDSFVNSSSQSRQSIKERYKDVSNKGFQKIIADKTEGKQKQTRESAFTTFYGYISFKFGKNKNKNLILENEKEKFKEFLNFQTRYSRTKQTQLPKDTPISEIMPTFKLHEMKFQSKSPLFYRENQNLQQICEDGYAEHENDKHNLLQYEDSYLVQQAQNLQHDLISYREYKKSNEVNEYTEREYDGWYHGWAKTVDQEFKMSKPEVINHINTLDSVKTVINKEKQRQQSIKTSLLQMLMKIIRLNLSIKEVYENKLFMRDQIPRKKTQEFLDAIKQNNKKDFNLLINEDKYLVYSSDHLVQTPLHWATKRGNLKLVISLIRLNSDVEARDIFGRTPLYYAYREGHKEIAVVLMKNRACPWSDKQNNISQYANHMSNLSIYGFYKLVKKMHLMVVMSPPRQKFDIWKDFKTIIDRVY